MKECTDHQQLPLFKSDKADSRLESIKKNVKKSKKETRCYIITGMKVKTFNGYDFSIWSLNAACEFIHISNIS